MQVTFRKAIEQDLPFIVALLADDELGSQREDISSPTNPAYVDAFAAIESDPNNLLLVVESQHQLVGMLQLTFIPYLTHIGTWRCLIEGVRIHSAHRGKGYGELMFQQAIELAREKGCKLVQLTSDKQRPDAIRFYEKLGFIASHEGFKLTL
jgi:ribosomal protein S18 acetylase RimI-like enzyme